MLQSQHLHILQDAFNFSGWKTNFKKKLPCILKNKRLLQLEQNTFQYSGFKDLQGNK